MVPGPQPTVRTDGYIVGTHGSVGVLVWTGPASVEGCAVYDELLSRMTTEHERIGSVVVIEDNGVASRPPSERARSALVHLFRRHGSRLAGVALVFEGEGFKASIVRIVVSTLTLAVRGPFRTVVCSDTEEAADWLCERLAEKMRPAELVAAIHRLRAV
jgi:hypothetical protein